MSRGENERTVPRRSFITRALAGAAAFAAILGVPRVQAQSAAPSSPAAGAAAGWQPARHSEDDWFDDTSAKHRLFFDTTTPDTLGQGMAFARNFFEANATGYGLKDGDLAQVLCLRHRSTAFAFSNAMWAKYGAQLSERADNIMDPSTKQVPTVNLYEVEGARGTLKNNGITLTALAKRGVRYAVCSMSTRRAATLIAEKTGAKVDEVYSELTHNLVPNARMVPAGIVAVNRAQERGYTLSTVV